MIVVWVCVWATGLKSAAEIDFVVNTATLWKIYRVIEAVFNCI